MPQLKIFRPGEDESPPKIEEPQFLLRVLADMFAAEVEAKDENYAVDVKTVLAGFVNFAESELQFNEVVSYRVVRNSNGSKTLWVLRRDRKWVRVTAPEPPDPDAA